MLIGENIISISLKKISPNASTGIKKKTVDMLIKERTFDALENKGLVSFIFFCIFHLKAD